MAELVVVPIVPTEEMCRIGLDAARGETDWLKAIGICYTAMVKAVPSQAATSAIFINSQQITDASAP